MYGADGSSGVKDVPNIVVETLRSCMFRVGLACEEFACPKV
jgi:hypothetical protein